MAFFAEQMLVSLIRSHLFIFVFISTALVGGGVGNTDLRKHWYNLCHRMFCQCSLLRVLGCHVLCLSLSRFAFIFLHSVWVCSSFIDFYAGAAVILELRP